MHIKIIIFNIALCLTAFTKAAPTPEPLLDGVLGDVVQVVDDLLGDLLDTTPSRRPIDDYRNPRGGYDYSFPTKGGRDRFGYDYNYDYEEPGNDNNGGDDDDDEEDED